MILKQSVANVWNNEGILKINGPIYLDTQIYVSHSNQFQNYKFWILANYYGKIDLEILAPESLSELLLLCRKPKPVTISSNQTLKQRILFSRIVKCNTVKEKW